MSFKFLFKQIIIITESEILRETVPQIWGCHCKAPVTKQLGICWRLVKTLFANGSELSRWLTIQSKKKKKIKVYTFKIYSFQQKFQMKIPNSIFPSITASLLSFYLSFAWQCRGPRKEGIQTSQTQYISISYTILVTICPHLAFAFKTE